MARLTDRYKRLTWITAIVGLLLTALAVALHQVPGPEAWWGARLALIGVLPIALCGLILPPYFLALMPRRWERKGGPPGFFVAAILGVITLLFMFPLMLALAFVPTAYEPAAFLLLVGWGWGLVLAGSLVSFRKKAGPARKLLGPLRAWMAGVLFYLVAMALVVPLAWHNPTLRHRTYSLRARTVQGVEGVAVGADCELDVGWFQSGDGARCWVRFWCDGQRLYGGYKEGIVQCAVTDEGRHFKGEDSSGSDGDPQLRMDTARGRVALAYGDADIDKEPAIAAEMVLEQER